jgi:energy-converting hydrogenase A subunit P
MSVTVSLESCVRSLSIKSECVRCKDACGYEAVSFNNYSVHIDTLSCTDCAACVGVCPSGAITMQNAGLASLSADELFCAALEASDEIVVNVQKELENSCKQRADEANVLLGFFGVSAKIKVNAVDEKKGEPKDASKRALFKMFTKEGVRAAHDSVKSNEEITADIDYALLKSKKVPSKRALFLRAVDEVELADKEAMCELSFASDKHIDDTCDNCSLCYHLCPSGALEVTGMNNAIVFSPHLCIKCRLCEDVCDTKSISSMPMFPLFAFKNRQKKLLKKFAVKLCDSCGAVFSGEAEECPRCTLESEDAMELLGL